MDSVSLLSALLDEERRLRSLAEAEVRAYRRTLTKLALRLAPAAFDARRRQDPTSFERFSPEQWEAFFASVERKEERAKQGWEEEGGQASAVRGQRKEDRRQTSAVSSQLTAVSQPPTANSVQSSENRRQSKVQQAAIAGSQPPNANRQPPIPDRRPLKADRSPLSSDAYALPSEIYSLPSALSPLPPSRYGALFANWEREGLALQILATTGWSLRYAMDEALATAVGIGSGSGSIKRLFARLEKLGLVTSQVYDLGGVRAAILLLSERGKQVAQGCGFALVPSEWELLLQAHGGERQTKHAALCCAFAYQTRKRGWQVDLCPNVEGPAQPDMRLYRDEASLYVEVEAESGEAERRMRKWRNQADLQGYVALCANNGGVRERLVLEAQAASKHGVATDLTALIKEQDEGKGLWVERWGRKAIGG